MATSPFGASALFFSSLSKPPSYVPMSLPVGGAGLEDEGIGARRVEVEEEEELAAEERGGRALEDAP